ncbi:MAG: hypothetical protein KAR21_21815 [Spirochaetales bacterium]|nr:hypothetical protein [Spirochaetales bacterium]
MEKNMKVPAVEAKTSVRMFTEWENIAASVADAFRMDKEEREWFQNKNLAKLIAAIPYLAGCEDPGRTAITHLGAYILSIRIKTVANCQPTDDADLFRRLEMINNFIGGDQAIIQKGMGLIALNMIADYARDIEEDRMFGKYNPVDSGAFDYEYEKKRLETIIKTVECREMDEIMSLDAAIEKYWEAG